MNRIALQNLFNKMCADGDLLAVKRMVKDETISNKIKLQSGVFAAAETGQLEIEKFLIGELGLDPTSSDYLALLIAVGNGHRELVDYLLTDPRVDVNEAYRLVKMYEGEK